MPITDVHIGSEIGPGGMRALCACLLGRGLTMKQVPYKHVKTLRFWRAGATDAGVAAVVSA